MIERLLIAFIVVFLGMYGYGMLYLRGWIGKAFAPIVGAVMGLATAYAVTGFDLDYPAATVATTAILVVIPTILYPLLATAVIDATRKGPKT